MEKKITSEIMLTLLLVSMFTFAVNIQPVKASGTIYIRANGSIEPSTTNINSTDNFTYYFTDNNFDSIVVERSDITIDGNGHTLQGNEGGRGFTLENVRNVTIKNIEIKQFGFGIYMNHSSSNTVLQNVFISIAFECIRLYESSNNIIVGNNLILNDIDGITLYGSSNNNITKNYLMSNYDGIRLYESSDNSITDNIVIDNYYGIFLAFSLDNDIINNNVTANHGTGISLKWSSNENRIVKNHVTSNNLRGMRLNESSNNVIYHNNFVDNTEQVHSINSTNIWDDGYPAGGNYWSDCNGTDLYSGSCQNMTGSDGIGDTPYIIDDNNQDDYPLMNPYDPSIVNFRVLYYDLLEKYNELINSYNALSLMYYDLLSNYSELRGNYDSLQTGYDNLQASFHTLNITYYGLLTNYNSLNSNYNNLQANYDLLNSTYNELESKQEATINELNNIGNLMYIFIATTVSLIATTVYLAIRKPKLKTELGTT